jgi:hypothetical protein
MEGQKATAICSACGLSPRDTDDTDNAVQVRIRNIDWVAVQVMGGAGVKGGPKPKAVTSEAVRA